MSREVRNFLSNDDVAGVVVLTDVHPDFASAQEAKAQFARIASADRFHARCALFEFEAWLLPYWQVIYQKAGKPAPKSNPWPSPEKVNHTKPPSKHLEDLYASSGRKYLKRLEAPGILRG